MALYEELCKVDIVQPLQSGFERNIFKMSPDGKIRWSTTLEPHRPWISGLMCPDRNCTKWLGIYFKYYHVISRGCRNCWKVAYVPKNLSKMFKVLELQEEMKIPSKSGVETRSLTGNVGGYASFWYAPLGGGLKQARELYTLVETKLTTLLGEKPKGLFLKRGCTEMEHHTIRIGIGGSDKWEDGAEHYNMTEDLADATFLDPEVKRAQEPGLMIVHTKRVWIEWAFEHNDESYLEFTEGAFKPDLVSYKDSIHSERDFRTTWKEKGGNGDRELETDVEPREAIALI